MIRSAFLLTAIFLVPPSAVSQDAEPKTGEVREFEIANGVKMKFCWIPPGKAILGSPETEKDRYEHEKERKFETKGFWLGKYPVTQKEYQAVMGENPSWFCDRNGPNPFRPDPSPAKPASNEPVPQFHPGDPAIGNFREKVKGMDTSRFPVENVRPRKIEEFLKKCKLKGLQLPHEDEWEYACRGGKGNKQPYYWGDALKGDKANCRGSNVGYNPTTGGTYLQRTSEVGAYEKAAPHPWGLCDMHGNVWERCLNDISRGGSWESHAHACRAAYRLKWNVSYDPDNFGGFRLCLPQKWRREEPSRQEYH